MKTFLLLFLMSLVTSDVFASDKYEGVGSAYVYSGVVLNDIDGTDQNLKVGKTYDASNGLFFSTPTNNQSILYFSNEMITKMDVNTEFHVVTFEQEFFNWESLPSALKVGDHTMVCNLNRGSVVINTVGKSSVIVSTPCGDVEIKSSATVLIKYDRNELLVYCYNGSVVVYTNRGAGTVLTNRMQITSSVNKFPVRGDTRKFQTRTEVATVNKQKEYDELLLKDVQDPIRGNVLFANVNKKVVGINLR